MRMPAADAMLGYKMSTVVRFLEILGISRRSFQEWMIGRTMSIEDGESVVYVYDFQRFLVEDGVKDTAKLFA